jgi:curved DNA-binding protein CbpA
MKKVPGRWIEMFFLILFLGIIGITHYKTLSNLNKKEQIIKRNETFFKKVKDSMDMVQFANYYLNSQFDISFRENNLKYDIKNVKLYILKDGKHQFERVFGSMLTEKRKKLIIRYTEIGCNSCSDSTIRAISSNKNIREFFDIIFFVDFSNYDAYLKWRKIAEISDPVFWVEKGSLPFTLEGSNDSYLYTVDEYSKPGNFFVPNSRLPNYINIYLTHISKKNLSIH